MKATVKVENLKIYAYHGCMEEEKIIGSDYIVNVTAESLLKKEAFEDDISKTVNYVDLARIVTREMGVRSKMLESVVKRICFCLCRVQFSTDLLKAKTVISIEPSMVAN